jgi:hypothetical protein
MPIPQKWEKGNGLNITHQIKNVVTKYLLGGTFFKVLMREDKIICGMSNYIIIYNGSEANYVYPPSAIKDFAYLNNQLLVVNENDEILYTLINNGTWTKWAMPPDCVKCINVWAAKSNFFGLFQKEDGSFVTAEISQMSYFVYTPANEKISFVGEYDDYRVIYSGQTKYWFPNLYTTTDFSHDLPAGVTFKKIVRTPLWSIALADGGDKIFISNDLYGGYSELDVGIPSKINDIYYDASIQLFMAATIDGYIYYEIEDGISFVDYQSIQISDQFCYFVKGKIAGSTQFALPTTAGKIYRTKLTLNGSTYTLEFPNVYNNPSSNFTGGNFANGYYCFFLAGGGFVYSTDLTSFSASQNLSAVINDCFYDGMHDVYMFAASDGSVYTSDANFTTFSKHPTGLNDPLKFLLQDSNRIIVISENGSAMASYDGGATWDTQVSSLDGAPEKIFNQSGTNLGLKDGVVYRLEFNQMLSLDIAGKSKLGGIKIGENLEGDVDGTLNVPAATADKLGVSSPSDANPAADGIAAPGTATTYSRSDHVHPITPDATTSARGLMSADDKTKLDGVEAGAQVNPQAGNSYPKYNGSPSPGTSANYSREDHVHGRDSEILDAIDELKAQITEMRQWKCSFPHGNGKHRTGGCGRACRHNRSRRRSRKIRMAG